MLIDRASNTFKHSGDYEHKLHAARALLIIFLRLFQL